MGRLILCTALPWALAGLACTGAEADLPPESKEDAPRVHAVTPRRGSFVVRRLLTGTLEAAEAAHIIAPRIARGDLQIRWMEEDGVPVRQGQTVLEFANDAFTADLEEKKLTARKAAKELVQLESQAKAETAEKAFAVEERSAELEKARIEADIPIEILPKREYQERQLAFERARAAYEDARDEHESLRAAKRQELEIQRLALEKTEFEIRTAEDAIELLSLEAPRDGLLVISDLPWEGRKLIVGDAVWPGFVLMTIPDLSVMQVSATLSDVDDGQVVRGMEARVTLDSYPDRHFAATVEDITHVRAGNELSLDAACVPRPAPARRDGLRAHAPRDVGQSRNLRRASRECPTRTARLPRLRRNSASGTPRGRQHDTRDTRSLQRIRVHRRRRHHRNDAPGVEETPVSLRRLLGALVVLAAVGAWVVQRGLTAEPGYVDVERGDLVLAVELEGTLEAVHSHQLGPPSVRGLWEFNIASMAPEGENVSQGTPVVSFDDAPLRKRLVELEAQLETATKEIEKKHIARSSRRRDDALRLAEAEGRLEKAVLKLQRPAEFVKRNEALSLEIDRELAQYEVSYLENRTRFLDAADGTELSILEEERERATVRVQELRTAIERMTVVAPRGGTVVHVSNRRGEKKRVGETIWQDDKVVAIPDLTEMKAEGTVGESHAGRLTEGQRVELHLDAHPEITFTGRVEKVGKVVVPKTRRSPLRVVRIEVTLDETDETRMRPDMRFRGSIETARIEDRILIPLEAVRRLSGRTVVYRESLRGAQPVAVKLGRSNDTHVEVLDGVTEDDRVQVF